MVFFETMLDVMELSRSACAFMMRSMFALQPYSEVVSTQGESAKRELTTTFSTLSPSTSFMSLVSGSSSAFSSSSFFFLVLVVDVQSLFRHRLEFLAVELLELLHGVLVDGVDHVKYLQALLPQRLEEGRGRDGCHTFACDVIDVVLTLLHAVDVLLEADLFVTRLRALVPHQLRDLRAVCGILVHSLPQALAELFVELFVIVLLLSDLREHLQALFHQVFLDDPEDFVLLERLPGDVQWEVFGIHDALHEVQPLGHELVAIVHDEDAAHVQLDVVALLLGLEQIEGRSPRHEEQSAKLQLTLHPM